MNDNHQNTEGYRQHAELRNKGLLGMNKLGNSAIKNTMGLGLNSDTRPLTKPVAGGRYRPEDERLIQRGAPSEEF
jgi:hypothetical protein